MKTLKLNMAIVAIITAFFALMPTRSSAQIFAPLPYKINNGLNCSVNVVWTFYDGSSCSHVCCTGAASIPAGGSINLPGGAPYLCSPACMLDITITGAGISAPGITVSFPNSPSALLPVVSNCGTLSSKATCFSNRCDITP